MFLENQIGPDDKRKEVVYSSFRRNLEDILRTARGVKRMWMDRERRKTPRLLFSPRAR